MIEKHTPRKRFGQNFLHDQQCINKIIAAINPQPHDNIIEIGPGQGALTEPLLKHQIHLSAIEIDNDLADLLSKKFALHKNFNLYHQDALTFQFNTLCENEKCIVVGNLPYNISTPLLFHLFSFSNCFHSMYFMLQKEVADRMSAIPGSKAYGRLSVMTQYFCQVRRLFLVPPNAFFPQPKVQSAIVHLTPYTDDTRPFPETNFNLFKNVVTNAFSQRRKKLANSLKDLITKDALVNLGIDPSVRPETLGVNDFITLTNAISKAKSDS